MTDRLIQLHWIFIYLAICNFLFQNVVLYFDLVGHYCPRGTMSPTQFPCVEGTWTNLTNLISQEECYVCPKGFFCLRGVSTPSGLCFTGHYCPRGMHTAHLAWVALAFIEPRQLSFIENNRSTSSLHDRNLSYWF